MSQRVPAGREPIGWIRRVVLLAQDVAEELYALDGDGHPEDPDPKCGFCIRRRKLSRAAKMAQHQLGVIEMNRWRRKFNKLARKEAHHD